MTSNYIKVHFCKCVGLYSATAQTRVRSLITLVEEFGSGGVYVT